MPFTDEITSTNRPASAAPSLSALILMRNREAATAKVEIVEAPKAPNEDNATFQDTAAQSAPFSVELIPGSSRILTTVLDPVSGEALFRIPTWWKDIEDALGVNNRSFYV